METQHSQLKATYVATVTTDSESHTLYIVVDVRDDDQYWLVDYRAKGQALLAIRDMAYAEQNYDYETDLDSLNVQVELLAYSY